MNKLLPLLLLLLALPALAAPRKITAVYALTRNGQPFATQTETFTQQNGRYHIETLTSGIGVYALLGQRKMRSEGEITASGLKPQRFEQLHDERKKSEADFDWPTQTITHTNAKNKTSNAALPAGTLDWASFPYQFMFQPPAGESLSLVLTTGKKLRRYGFRILPQEEYLADVMGGIKTRHLSPENPGDDEKELWLAVERHFLPAKIIGTDDNGGKLEQVLTDLKVE